MTDGAPFAASPIPWHIYWTGSWPDRRAQDAGTTPKQRRVVHTRTDPKTGLHWYACITSKGPTPQRAYRVLISRADPTFVATGLDHARDSFVDCEDYYPLSNGERSPCPVGSLSGSLRKPVMAGFHEAAMARMPDEE